MADDESRKDLDTSHMLMRVDPKAEWNEMFHMAWRLERDFFVNREDERRGLGCGAGQIPKLMPLMGHREDLNYLIGEMQGELSNSHTYVGGGDLNYDVKPVATGLLGADYGLDAKSGRYYIHEDLSGRQHPGGFHLAPDRSGHQRARG